MFQLTVLADNNTIIDKYLLGEPALSFYIEYDNKKILFDTGYSDVFISNAEKLGISLKDLDFIVLSHGHNDHAGGIKYLVEMYKNADKKPVIIACSGVFTQRYDLKDGEFGSPLSKEEIESCFRVKYIDTPKDLTENICFLGKIPRVTDFEAKESVEFIADTDEPDFVEDDSALAIKFDNEIILITGCSHSGIINICKYAQKILGLQSINSIIGGLHLHNAPKDVVSKTTELLAGIHPKNVYACHCTGLNFLCRLNLRLNLKEIGCGTNIIIPPAHLPLSSYPLA